ncbi:MAG: pore-forming ESAT-6 family protein [Propionibacteriaceae bacterium]
MPQADRISFNTASSGVVQGDLGTIIGQLESLISTRDAQVSRAMADFQADGVSDDYHHVERRWNRASHEVKQIIHLVKLTMGKNDDTAGHAQTRAAGAVHNIG